MAPGAKNAVTLRVAHVIEDLGLGGAERLLATMLPALQEHGISSEVLALGTRSELANTLRERNVPVHILGLDGYRPSASRFAVVRDTLSRGSFDLVHTHLDYGNLYGRATAWRLGLRATTTYHNCDYEKQARRAVRFGFLKQKAFQSVDWVTARHALRVVAVSEYVKKSIVRRLRFSPDDVEVIVNGVAKSSVEYVSNAARRAARRELGLPEHARIVVQVGRLTPQKGQRHTLEAASRLERKKHDMVWILVGGGPLRDELEHESERRGLRERVRFTGALPDVRPYLRAADVFVFPSLYEGLGIAVLEAMAMGVPVVAYDTGPLPEVVVHGETGMLVPSGDTEGLAAGVEALVQAPRKSEVLGAAGRKRVEEEFLIPRTAARHAAFYRQLVGATRRTLVHPAGSSRAELPSVR